ncbi:DUF222 domain-containing protein [Gordonia sp. X0973]|uniref:DUF222 domain-containing protein n=1 Tax=Gordonia sp. X0973 TaxID=2742602 RepID=UPI0015821874|nr:DUF222 domain-containing protein [Gordonia sp. X0973]QKT06770.1 DUF222 domain-containing protein [Gordonia sp. X0973]
MRGQFIVTASIADLKAGCGFGLTTTGTLIPIGELIDVAAQLDPSLVVFADHTREVLYYGRARRGATLAQRCALFARDRGDSNPDSETPFITTEAHHLPDWALGGLTDIDKLTATSGPNNRRVGPGPRQWETVYQRTGPFAGRVAWRLRCHNGTAGQPRVNLGHHPDDLARVAINNIRAIGGKGTTRYLHTASRGDTNSANTHGDHNDPDPPRSPTEHRLRNRLGYTEI